MPVKTRKIAKRFFPIFLPIAAVTIVVVYVFFALNQRVARDIIENDEEHNIEHLTAVSSGDLRSVIADLLILSDHNKHLGGFTDSHIVGTDELVHEFISVSSRKRVYDQIRYIDKGGKEVVRVNYSGGKVESTPTARLQNKKSRYYFQESIKLKQGEIFVSQLDLNMENDVIEEPRKPVMRLGTPVFDVKGHKRGIVLMNYLGGEFLGKLKKHHGSNMSRLMVLNREGYYLVGQKREDEWGFMYEDRADRKFQNAYPGVWKKILQEKDGQVYSRDGLFTFATVYPVLDALGWKGAGGVKNRRYFLRIVSFVPTATLDRQMDAAGYVQGGGLVLLAFAVLSWFLARARARRRRIERKLDACERDHKEGDG